MRPVEELFAELEQNNRDREAAAASLAAADARRLELDAAIRAAVEADRARTSRASRDHDELARDVRQRVDDQRAARAPIDVATRAMRDEMFARARAASRRAAEAESDCSWIDSEVRNLRPPIRSRKLQTRASASRRRRVFYVT